MIALLSECCLILNTYSCKLLTYHFAVGKYKLNKNVKNEWKKKQRKRKFCAHLKNEFYLFEQINFNEGALAWYITYFDQQVFDHQLNLNSTYLLADIYLIIGLNCNKTLFAIFDLKFWSFFSQRWSLCLVYHRFHSFSSSHEFIMIYLNTCDRAYFLFHGQVCFFLYQKTLFYPEYISFKVFDDHKLIYHLFSAPFLK